MAQKTQTNVVPITELHCRLGGIVRRVALNKEHIVVEKGGLPVVVMLSMAEYEELLACWRVNELKELARELGREAERQGYTEEQMMIELEEDKRAVYRKIYGEIPE